MAARRCLKLLFQKRLIRQQVQVADATIADVKVGNSVMVWGAKNGERITAEVIYIQTAGR